MMKLKEFFGRALFYLSVPKCVGCGEKLEITDGALCRECLDDHLFLKTRDCSRCAKTLDFCSCTNKYLREHRIKKLIKVYRYIFTEENSPSNNLIYSLKRDNRKDVVEFLADELAKSVLHSVMDPHEWIITNVPRRAESVRRYGMDHSAMLAKALAKKLGAQYKRLLVSKAKKQQKHTRGEERLRNAVAMPRKNAESLKGKRLILIDDIVTTGASMVASAKAIYQLGAKTVIGAAVAIAYKDEYVPFPKLEYKR